MNKTSSNNRSFEYFAFISYKREDEKWAKWLQKKLESYSLPTAIRKENPKLPSKIRPVFRDQSELSGGNLKAEIEKGLNGSRYLIVICSPCAVQSPWVSKEVQHFIDQGRAEYIIPFIIEGVPNAANPEKECFPKGLRQLTDEKEILGININEMGRDAAAIKVIARMFNLRFDSLWQRDKRTAKRKKIIITTGLMSVIFVTILFIIALWKKNTEIKWQNARLDTLVANLKEENKTYSMRNITERYTYKGAIRGNDSDEWLMQIVYHPTEPIIAFSDDWGFWLHYIKTNTEILLPGSNEIYSTMSVDGLKFSEDGSKLIASSWGGLFIWNVDNHKLINHFSINELLNSDSGSDVDMKYDDCYSNGVDFDSIFMDNKYTFSYFNNNLTVYSPDIVLATTIESDKITILKNPVYDEILFVGMNRAVVFDEQSNKFVQFFKGYESEFHFSANGDYLRIGKDLFERNLKIDTIKPNQYLIEPLDDFPCENIEDEFEVNENDKIKYQIDGKTRIIEVIKPYTIGNSQEYLSNAIFVAPNKIVAIVGQGKHRVYNAISGELIGTLTNYVWDGNESYGHEQMLCHAESFIAYSKVVRRKLYVISSGGILRIYDIDKLRQIKLIELPFKGINDERVGAIDKCYISSDGSRVCYSFFGQSHFYDLCIKNCN